MKWNRALMTVCAGFSLIFFGFGAGPFQAAGADKDEKLPLAIKGYDPVAYFTEGRPVAGTPDHEFVFDEVRYRFASNKNLKTFEKDPDRYTPQYGGLCAMGLAAKGYKVEANPENWTIHDGKLYVTQRDFGPPIFRKDPERWVASANVHVAALKNLPIGSALSWW